MAVNQKVTLYNNKFTVPPVINAVQNDTDRQVEAYFGDFTLQVGMTGKLSFIRSDGTHYEVSATLSTANNTATAELAQALTQAGVTQAQLKITDSGNVGSTFTFMIKVQPDVAGISQQQDGYSVEEIVQRLSDAEDAIEDVEDDVADLQGKEYDYAPVITDTASGSIANFPDGADGYPMRSVVAEINPVQSGSGDPSPDNVRPISGFSQANIAVTGINIWDEEWEAGTYNGSTGAKQASTAAIRNANPISIISGESYYLNFGSNLGSAALVFLYDHGMNYLGNSSVSASRAITFSTGVAYINFRVVVTTYNNDISINYPSTDTAYHEHVGTTHTIPLGRTVYGGTVDAVSGKLTAKWGIITYDGSSDESWGGTQNGGWYITLNSLKKRASVNEYKESILCNILVVGSSYQANGTITGYIDSGGSYPNDNWLYIGKNDITSVANFKTWLSSNNLQVCYELATPVEYDLDPTEIKSLIGDNNVWTDTNGNITVAYCADTKLYIDKKLSEL